jgi:uncharacterized membrane protein
MAFCKACGQDAGESSFCPKCGAAQAAGAGGAPGAAVGAPVAASATEGMDENVAALV